MAPAVLLVNSNKDVGNQALCRVAAALRFHCRLMDTAARQGGDEFALVLPETNATAAREVARRICERVAADPERPPLRISAGVAASPQDGETIQSLFDVADRNPYQEKGRSVPQFGAPQQQRQR